jgi:hypothetical protein
VNNFYEKVIYNTENNSVVIFILAYGFAGAAAAGELVISIVLAFIRFTRWTKTINHIMPTTKKSTTPASTNQGHRNFPLGGSGVERSPVMAPAIGTADWWE